MVVIIYDDVMMIVINTFANGFACTVQANMTMIHYDDKKSLSQWVGLKSASHLYDDITFAYVGADDDDMVIIV